LLHKGSRRGIILVCFSKGLLRRALSFGAKFEKANSKFETTTGFAEDKLFLPEGKQLTSVNIDVE